MQAAIEQVLSGSMRMEKFLETLQHDDGLKSDLCNIIPADARDNPSHPLWSKISYDTVRGHGYDFNKHLAWLCKSKNKFGRDLDLFAALKIVYLYHHPNFFCTNQYHEAFALYLDAIQNCFDGPEVSQLVTEIIENSMQLRTKAQRVANAKAAVKQQFHVTDRKRPNWVQGPEWPMGIHSPMAFVSMKRSCEAAIFVFTDIDTSDTRAIIQHY